MRTLFLALVAGLALAAAACGPGGDQRLDPVPPAQPGSPGTVPGATGMETPFDDGYGP